MWRVAMLAWMALGCGSSSDPADAAIEDAPLESGAEDAGEDAAHVPEEDAAPRCGDLRVDPGEQCDDGLDSDNVACDDACERGPRCGDGVTDDGEVCDDGERASRDGCAPNCLSDESCGNGVVDLGAGELCDDEGETCDDTCRIVTSCGDGSRTIGEPCDDGDLDPFDGCGADCHHDATFILKHLLIAEPGVGCDLDGDGTIDNAFSDALASVRAVLNGESTRQIEEGRASILLVAQGLDAESPVNDMDVLASLVLGKDTDEDVANNLDGRGVFEPRFDAFDEGLPRSRLLATIEDGVLHGGPGDVEIVVSSVEITVRDASLRARLGDVSESPRVLTEGSLCGTIDSRTLATAPNPLALFVGTAPPPCAGDDEPSLLDVFVGGISVFGLAIGPVSIDVDLDGDGLEVFEYFVADTGECWPSITACIDGDGTRIEGHDCVLDPRIADGFSAATEFEAIEARLVPAPTP